MAGMIEKPWGRGLWLLAVLSPIERADVERRLQQFYARPWDPAVMREIPRKFDVANGHFFPEHRQWRARTTEEFQRFYCHHVLRRKFPGFQCDSPPDETVVEANDRLDLLTQTWIPDARLVRTLEGLPVAGQTALPLWSDDYWRTRFGLTSYRYGTRATFPNYATAIASYAQPKEWLALPATLPPAELAKKLLRWSPAEKYDLSLGDEAFSLTNAQKEEGKGYVVRGDVENWMGLCHGWAAASVMVAPPKKPVMLAGPRQARVEWYPGDIKAMLTLAWSNGPTDSNYVGTRCFSKEPRYHHNGRLAAPQCFDTNPATFHLALGNLVGVARKSFLFDSSFDFEIWNQPVQSYELVYFDPLDWRRKSPDWRAMAVDYDARFKESDRFQKPLTRGVSLGNGRYDDSGIRKVVGVIAVVTYVIEFSPPPHQPSPPAAAIARAEYLYDLELHESHGKLVPRGGEWLHNTHPDFLWIPRADTYPQSPFDTVPLSFTGRDPAGEEAVKMAKLASPYSYPLCQPLKKLVAESTGNDTYRCAPLRP